jgi:peroxiredoxin/predicted 2-oxoglutarate/Fe(II)-dependent dioxygenase YbiX
VNIQKPLSIGDSAPWFVARSASNERYTFYSVAGRHVALAFYGTTKTQFGQKINAFFDTALSKRGDKSLCFFGVSTDSDDEKLNRVAEKPYGMRYLWDFDQKISTLYKAVSTSGEFQALVYILDPMLRVVQVFIFSPDDENFDVLQDYLNGLPKKDAPYLAKPQAPVLVVPNIFEPDLCKQLIEYYEKVGGTDSGFMREVDGKTVGMLDYSHKRRRDCTLEEGVLRTACIDSIFNKLVPVIALAFQFHTTRMERTLMACYDAEEQGHFSAHRDNTTQGTAHRKFAVSLFLNSGDYEGGYLKFPEFGSGHFAAPTGGAVVFSCSLLHQATQVTKGRRYMFLPFLYDEASELIRQKSASQIVDLSHKTTL